MKNWISGSLIVSFLLAFFSCHNDSEKYKDVLREGSWYVYDVHYSYQLYRKYETPGLTDFIHFMLEEQNLLFLPGDELVFSKNKVAVRTLNQSHFSYRYAYDGNYICIEDYRVEPEGSPDSFSFTFNEYSLEDFLEFMSEEDERYLYLLEEMRSNLKNFHITYLLQRPVPLVAQIISDIYTGPLYDGESNLVYEDATLDLFYDQGKMNLGMYDKIYLENGPQFLIQIRDLEIKEGYTPGSYEFSGRQTISDPQFGTILIEIADGRFYANNTVSADFEISWNGLKYSLIFHKGIRQWQTRDARVKSRENPILLHAGSSL